MNDLFKQNLIASGWKQTTVFVARHSYVIDSYYEEYGCEELRCVSRAGAEALLETLASQRGFEKDEEFGVFEDVGFIAPDGTVWAFSDNGPEQVLSETEAEAEAAGTRT